MKNIAIVGLSSFGFYLCRKLSAMNYNIMAIDIKEELVNQVKPYVRKAVIGDAKDKAFLQKLGITDFETVIVSVGNKFSVTCILNAERVIHVLLPNKYNDIQENTIQFHSLTMSSTCL